MRRIICLAVAIAIIFGIAACGASDTRTPTESPNLYAILTIEGQSTQRIRAIQGVTNWFWNGGGYMSDSAHPLQLNQRNFDTATLSLHGADGEIVLELSGNYPPTSIYARRWRAEYATGGQPTDEMFDNWEPIEVDGTVMRINNNGEDYIYEISAIWPDTDSFATYALRVMHD